MTLKKYTIKLQNLYAFGSEDTILEASDEIEAIELARKLYPNAEEYIIIAIEN